MYKIKLKNSDSKVLVDNRTYDFLTTDRYLAKINFLQNVRMHSSGCCFFQRNIKFSNGSFKVETIYLHKLIAEKFLIKKNDGRNLVGTINGNKLDCRVDNLIYRTRSEASRVKKSSSRTGYTGVYKEGSRYRAVIGINGKAHHLGMYDTPEQAAQAYNETSRQVYGKRGKINIIKNLGEQ